MWLDRDYVGILCLNRASSGLWSDCWLKIPPRHRASFGTRDHLVRPLTVEFPDSGLRISGFSPEHLWAGDLLVAAPVVERSVARLTVHRLAEQPGLLAECRWPKPFGSDWNISGWQFINIVQ